MTLLVTLTLGIVVGCGSTAQTSQSAAPSPTRAGKVQLAGALTVNGSFKESFGKGNCTTYAKKGEAASSGTVFVLPLAKSTKVGSHTISLPALQAYHGPKAYPGNGGFTGYAFYGTSPITVDGVGAGAGDETTVYLVTVNSDGSGSYAFSGVPYGAATLAGTITWTCKDS